MLARIGAFAGLVVLIAVLPGCKEKGARESAAADAASADSGGSVSAETAAEAEAEPEGAVAETDPAPASELWRLAPPETKVGIVAAPGAAARIIDAVSDLLARASAVPESRKLLDEAREGIQGELPWTKVMLEKGPEAFGINPRGEVALFISDDGPVAVIPVSDAALLAKETDGRCQPVEGRKLFAACAVSEELRKSLGSGPGMGEAAAAWPAKLAGDIKILVGDGAVPQPPAGMRLAGTSRAAIKFEPGGFTLRFHVAGAPAPPLFPTPKLEIAQDVAKQHPSGVMLVQLYGFWPLIRKQLKGTPSSPFEDLSVDEVLAAMNGEFVIFIPESGDRGIARIGFQRMEVAEQIVKQCADGKLKAIPGIKVESSADGCVITSTEQRGFQKVTVRSGAAWLELDARLDLAGNSGMPQKTEPLPFADELLSEPWLVASWGSGSIVGASPGAQTLLSMLMEKQEVPALVPWAVGSLAEGGIGVRIGRDGVHGFFRGRTLWGNPPEIADALEPALADWAQGKPEGGKRIVELAKAHPKSALARDLAGPGSAMSGVAVLGITAAVAVPAFMKYIKKSKSAEAVMHVRSLATLARAAREEGRLPKKSAKPTPALGRCCEQGSKCTADRSLWRSKPWSTLGFSIDDDHYYSVEYTAGKGGSFTVSAYGDLDCDGNYSTFRSVDDGSGPLPEVQRVQELE